MLKIEKNDLHYLKWFEYWFFITPVYVFNVNNFDYLMEQFNGKCPALYHSNESIGVLESVSYI